MLADLAQKALDAVSAGYVVEVPQLLMNVDRSSYRRRSSPAVLVSDPEVFTVCVLGLESSVKADTLEEALKVAYNLVGVCTQYVVCRYILLMSFVLAVRNHSYTYAGKCL
jgi:hypothetical protein